MKRLFNVGVLLLAGLTFFLVPVGRRTPSQHLTAILSTRPAREASAAFMGAARRAAAQASAELTALREAKPKPKPSSEPELTKPSADP